MNIVFDLGGVVFSWQPDAIISSIFGDVDSKRLVRKSIFEHPDWVELDRGTIPLPQAIDRGAARTGLPARDIERLLDAVPRFLVPIEATFELIRSLAGTGHRLYVLSNMHLASIAHLQANYDIWDLFDGIVFSCSVRMVKPERGIYEHLLKEHRLDPADTIFIDDVAENLAVAASFGIRTIHFSDPEQCANALRAAIGE